MEDNLIIYKATNVINNKVYIGQTKNSLETRMSQHLRDAKCKKKKNTYFQDAIEKYGEHSFVFEIIDEVNSPEEADEKERYWISFYNSTDKKNGYNLDSGGIKGGVKSIETKEKIGETTKQKWQNPEIAKKMREGLAKGTETVKKNKKRYLFVCPVCGKNMWVEKYNLLHRKYCSIECATKDGNWEKGVSNSAKIAHKKNVERKEKMREKIIEWCRSNKDTVINCPKNSISSTLSGLSVMLKNEYDIKDLRSIFICFNVNNKKELLNKLKDCVLEENIC